MCAAFLNLLICDLLIMKCHLTPTGHHKSNVDLFNVASIKKGYIIFILTVAHTGTSIYFTVRYQMYSCTITSMLCIAVFTQPTTGRIRHNTMQNINAGLNCQQGGNSIRQENHKSIYILYMYIRKHLQT